MILRKPYALLIKSFRLIHIILTICMVYLLYKSYSIYQYLNEFIHDNLINTDSVLVNRLFNKTMLSLPIFIIIILIVLLVIMFKKNKPKTFYFVNIAVYILTIAVYSYLNNTLTYMETNIMSNQNVKLALDITFILMMTQLISTIISLIRSIGLDLKKFDFGKDLMELQINEEDSEEFEVNIEVDSDSFKRELNRKIRYAKYVYAENRLLINAIVLVILLIIGISIYLKLNVNRYNYKENTIFDTTDYTLNIKDSYIINTDSKNNKLKNNKTLLVLNVSAKENNNLKELNLAKMEIYINGNIYHASNKYNDLVNDLGIAYNNQELVEEFNDYLIIYEIPLSELSDKILLKYLNNTVSNNKSLRKKYIKILIEPKNLMINHVAYQEKLNNSIVLNETYLKKSTLEITELEIAKEFVNEYNFCLSDEECFPSKEYIKPVLNKNYDKVLLKINGNFSIDESIINTNLKNIFDVLTYVGRIEYTKDNKTFIVSNFTKVEPKRNILENKYYIELDSSITKSSKLELVIQLRNREYRYKIS